MLPKRILIVSIEPAFISVPTRSLRTVCVQLREIQLHNSFCASLQALCTQLVHNRRLLPIKHRNTFYTIFSRFFPIQLKAHTLKHFGTKLNLMEIFWYQLFSSRSHAQAMLEAKEKTKAKNVTRMKMKITSNLRGYKLRDSFERENRHNKGNDWKKKFTFRYFYTRITWIIINYFFVRTNRTIKNVIYSELNNNKRDRKCLNDSVLFNWWEFLHADVFFNAISFYKKIIYLIFLSIVHVVHADNQRQLKTRSNEDQSIDGHWS